jgi:Kef-type K+ transport system membrane component KefB
MNPDIVPLIAGLLVFVASIISLRLGISVAIIEIILGTLAGNLGMQPEPWMLYLANFGGIILTFLAGTEIDTKLMKTKFKESLTIGFLSFFVPFLVCYLCAYVFLHWSLQASLLAGIALSTTSLAIVYSVLLETGLSRTNLGKLLMAATFVTDLGTALALSLIFSKPTIKSLVFIVASIVILIVARKFTFLIFNNRKYKDKVIEPEIKYLFLILLGLIYFAKVGNGHAVLPVFVLGLLMSRYFTESRSTRKVIIRLRTVAYAIITPLFFLVGGMRVSLPMIWAGIGIFLLLFMLKLAAKFAGVFFIFNKLIPENKTYSTLLMSTGLTFGTITCQFGLTSGKINAAQYSILLGVVIASAVIPTFIAQKWFLPKEEEDVLDYIPSE